MNTFGWRCYRIQCGGESIVACQSCGLSSCLSCLSRNLPICERNLSKGTFHSFIDLKPEKEKRSSIRTSFKTAPMFSYGSDKVAAQMTPERSDSSSSLADLELSNDYLPKHSLSFDRKISLDSPDYTPHSSNPYHTTTTDFASIKIQDESSSVLLLDVEEKLNFNSAKELASALQCGENSSVKVVSIFGNTGDGKSHTLNHTFFDGQEMFKTSSSQVTGTVGVWASYEPHNKAIILDTEGLLGVTNNQNQRSRLLVKVFAISDIIIYRTRSDRLHSDTFQFLGDASAAYLKYFTSELKAISESNKVSVSNLGPALIVFHETSFTEPLKDDGDLTTTEQLKERFGQIKRSHEGFSSIRYIGTRTRQLPTDFSLLRDEVVTEIQKTAVRSTRPLSIVFKALQLLNDKFNGSVNHEVSNSLPDEYFTCTVQCLACKSRCCHSMNHIKSGKLHNSDNRCHYEEQYQNKLFICKKCWQGGEDRIVIPKTAQSGDSVWSGLVKYAWQGYVLECPRCGVIYNSRKYWYGNRNPEEECVRVEIAHVWPGANQVFQGSHNACRQLVDGLSNVAGSLSSLTAKPIEYVSDWAADQVAPSYWVPNANIKECHLCAKQLKDLNDNASEYLTNEENAEDLTETSDSYSIGSPNNERSSSNISTTKHHCRACGQGFCDACSSYKMTVPERGWGEEPVRVCFTCFNNRKDSKVTNTRQFRDEAAAEVKPRKITEAFRSSVSVLSSAAEFPKRSIVDYTRPAYWAEDSQLKNCYCCEVKFDVASGKVPIHHCRSCGNGVCNECSKSRVPVPLRGWDYPVRVCSICLKSGMF